MGALRRLVPLSIACLLSTALAACSGGGGSSAITGTAGSTASTGNTGGAGQSATGSPTTFTIGGTVTGLSGTLGLLDNGSDSLSLSQPGTFTFAAPVASGSPYAVTVASQPSAQYCGISGGSGTAAADVTSVMVGCDPDVLQVLYAFGAASTDGQAPQSELVRGGGSNSDLYYGVTAKGGAYGKGAVFEITPAGAETILYSFKGMSSGDGSSPYNAPTPVGSDLYGVTETGGTLDGGTIYELNSLGVETVLHSFKASTDGAWPLSSLLAVSSSSGTTFYGTTSTAGSYGYGTLFSFTTSGIFTTLHSFGSSRAPSLHDPSFHLLLASNGNIYGVTTSGGTDTSAGGVFAYDPSTNTYAVVHEFTGRSNGGAEPSSGLMQASDGDLYGVTTSGGMNSGGIVYRLNLDSTPPSYQAIYSFPGGNVGAAPFSTPYQASDGNLYVMTYSQGAYGRGTIVSISTSGVLQKVLHAFGGTSGLSAPGSGLLAGASGTLFGLASSGGPYSQGAIFKLY